MMNPTAENGVVTHDSSSSSSLSSSSLSLTEDSMIVVTFNVLAPLMAKPSWFEECSSEVLNPVYRMQQIKKELDDLIRTGQQLSKPETNCDGYYNIPLVLHLQELQAQDEEMWKIFFADRGYTGVQVYRKGDKAVSMGIEPVHLGVGIFWPTDCFDVVHCQSQVCFVLFVVLIFFLLF
jgi:mRNA deadenylase 3'-5' endonuclease subunit Ccr4